jgi:hypothetical protein
VAVGEKPQGLGPVNVPVPVPVPLKMVKSNGTRVGVGVGVGVGVVVGVGVGAVVGPTVGPLVGDVVAVGDGPPGVFFDGQAEPIPASAAAIASTKASLFMALLRWFARRPRRTR